MGSPGHRDNILDRWHKMVNVGLAWDAYNFQAFQHFEGDYVEYAWLPAMEGSVLTVSGTTRNGVVFGSNEDLGVQVYYDPPPYKLTRGQVARTYCYDSGRPIAALGQPIAGGWSYAEDAFTTTRRTCPDPYEVPPDAPPPRSHDEAHDFWQAAYDASQAAREQSVTVPWITAAEWIAGGEYFFVRADLRDVVTEHGPGVYSIIVWGVIGGEDAVISEYSLFHSVTPPDTYGGG